MTRFIVLVVLGLLDRGDQLIINCLLRAARESSAQRADSAYPLGHGWAACFPRRVGCCPKARGWGPAGTLTAPLWPRRPLSPHPHGPPGAVHVGSGHPHSCAPCAGQPWGGVPSLPCSASGPSLWPVFWHSVPTEDSCPSEAFGQVESLSNGSSHTRVGPFGRGGSWEATLVMGCLFFAFISFPTKLPEMSFSCRIQRQLQGIR